MNCRFSKALAQRLCLTKSSTVSFAPKRGNDAVYRQLLTTNGPCAIYSGMLTREKQALRRGFLIISAFVVIAGIDFSRAAENSPSPDKAYTFGTVISFGASGGSERFKVAGWSKAEQEFTWTEGKGATFLVEVPPVETALALRMKLVGLIHPPEVSSQPVEVYVNGQKVAYWQVAAPANFTAMIPQKIAAAKKLEIELRTSGSTTPKALKMNDDTRILGVGCFEMEITKG